MTTTEHTHTTENTTESEPEFRLTIFHDDSPHDPPGSGDEFLTLYSFSTSHRSFKHPDQVFACRECGDTRDNYQHTDVIQVNDGDLKYGDWAAEFRADNPEDLHTYQGPEGWVLSYFEHGNCRWGRAGTMSGMPDFRWDGVAVAGFLEVHIDEDNWEWWEGKTEDERNEIADSFLTEYTEWCNGEIYGYSLERINPRVCDLGFTHEYPEDLDSCFGFIGFDWFQEEVSAATHSMGATKENTEVVDKAYGMAEYGDFFQVPETAATEGDTE